MHRSTLLMSLALSSSVAFGQASTFPLTFEVASVKPNQHMVGPDYNNQLTYSPNGLTAKNVTVKRLIAEAYHLQLNQILGPAWLDQNEYDVDARTADVTNREQMASMLRSLLAERFNLKEHSETRQMRAYDLVVGNSGPKIYPIKNGQAVNVEPGFHFHGDMRQFADLLAIQFSLPAAINPSEPARAGGPQVPVLDKTGLSGVYDFSVKIAPELGTDGFTSWQRVLQAQLGLTIESRKENVAVMVVDEAAKIPTPN